MAIDQYGRFVPDYIQSNNYNYGYPPAQQDYREELRKRRDAIDYQLSELDKRYQPPQPIHSDTPPTPAPKQSIIQPYIIVSNEQEARDYPIVNKIDDDIGKVYFFILRDESAIFAKRINPSTFDMEFEVYERKVKSKTVTAVDISNGENDTLTSIDARLKKIETFVDDALMLFTNPTSKSDKSEEN